MKAKITRIAIGYAPSVASTEFKITFNPLNVKIKNGVISLSGLPEGLDEETALRDLAWSLREKSNKTRTHSKVILAAIEAKLQPEQTEVVAEQEEKVINKIVESSNPIKKWKILQ